MFNPYGEEIWSGNLPPAENSYLSYGVGLAALVGAGAVGGNWLTQGDANYRPIDTLMGYAQLMANASPFQVGRTLHANEFMSPFGSNASLGMMAGELNIPASHFENRSTSLYLEKVTGKSSSELGALGIGPSAVEKATELKYRRDPNKNIGSLFSVVNGQETLISDKVSMMAAGVDHFDPLSPMEKAGSTNKALHSVMQSLDMWSDKDFDPDKVFSGKTTDVLTGEDVYQRLSYVPIPGVSTSLAVSSLGSFGLERFNKLTGSFVEGALGSKAAGILQDTFGTAGGVRPGTTAQMYVRLGGRALAVGGGLLLMQEADWLRRQGGDATNALVSGATSAVVAASMYKYGFKGNTALLAGAASFFGQMMLPGFDDGVLQGMATTWANATVLRANPGNLFSHYRRTVEGFLPGATSWQAGALLGVGALAFAYGKNPQSMVHMSNEALKLAKRLKVKHVGLDVTAPLDARDFHYEILRNEQAKHLSPALVTNMNKESIQSGRIGSYSRQKMLWELKTKMGHHEFSSVLNETFTRAEAKAAVARESNPVNDAMVKNLEDIRARYSGKTGVWNSIGKQFEGLATQTKFSFMGADPHYAGKAIDNLGFIRPLGKAGLVFGAAMLVHGVASGGLLGSMDTQNDLEEIYSGRQYVKVGKGRAWEMGGTPFEGLKGYFRPHAYALMTNRVRERSIWGEDEDSKSPLTKFFLKNFTYHLEELHYYDRPYPQSSAAFQDVPIIGNLLAAGFGSLIKPPKLMHEEAWMRDGAHGGVETLHSGEGWQREPGYRLGAQGPGIPYSVHQPGHVLARNLAQVQELSGLPGWVMQTGMKATLGVDELGPAGPILAHSGMMSDPGRRFWETSMGGALFQNEAIRRIFPQYEKSFKAENPIANTAATWLPAEFHTGDPYTKREWGDALMPGVGYATLRPELRGVDPEDYPLIYQYEILSTVAPMSKETMKTKQKLYYRRKEGKTSEQENQMMDNIDLMLKDRYNIYDFENMHKNAYQLPGSQVTQYLWKSARSALRHLVAPGEYLSPFGFRPFSKLMGDMDPIERYESERMYGTGQAFWDKPFRDWIRPAFYSAAHSLGYDGKTAWRREADSVGQYFDQVQFVKYMRLAEEARAQGQESIAIKYEYLAGGTRTGVNPQGNAMGMYWAVADEDRPYFNAFALAKGKDRDRILDLVPEDQTHLYKALWSRQDADDPGLIGFGRFLDTDYLKQRYAAAANQPLPPVDWIGYHCLPPNQNLLDVDLIPKEVSKFVSGDPVWQTNILNTVQEVCMREAVQETMVKLTVGRDRVNSMSATGNHKVFAWKCPWGKDHLRRKLGGKRKGINGEYDPSWIRIQELGVGDYLVVPVNTVVEKTCTEIDIQDFASQRFDKVRTNQDHVWTYYQDPAFANKMPKRLVLDSDMAWLIGYYLAEGHTLYRSGHARSIEFTSNLVAEADLRSLCLSILEAHGIEGSSERSRLRDGGDSGSVHVDNQIFAELVQYFVPGTAATKRLEHINELLTSPAHIESLLAGYFAGDGTKENNASTAVTVSERWAYQVAELMISIGMIPSFSTHYRKDRKRVWQIRFARISDVSRRVHDRIIRNVLVSRDVLPTKPQAFIRDGFLYSYINSSKSEVYSGLVYDLEVNNRHEYRCSIGLYHNSEVDLQDIKAKYVDSLGRDLHDFGLWESQLAKAEQQPYLEGSEQELAPYLNRAALYRDMHLMGAPPSALQVNQGNMHFGSAQLNYDDHRDLDIANQLLEYINGR